LRTPAVAALVAHSGKARAIQYREPAPFLADERCSAYALTSRPRFTTTADAPFVVRSIDILRGRVATVFTGVATVADLVVVAVPTAKHHDAGEPRDDKQ
jgi:hypothetical protein